MSDEYYDLDDGACPACRGVGGFCYAEATHIQPADWDMCEACQGTGMREMADIERELARRRDIRVTPFPAIGVYGDDEEF